MEMEIVYDSVRKQDKKGQVDNNRLQVKLGLTMTKECGWQETNDPDPIYALPRRFGEASVDVSRSQSTTPHFAPKFVEGRLLSRGPN